MSDDEIKECAASLNYKYFITSAVDGTNVETAFQEMGRLILSKTKNEEPSMKCMGCRGGLRSSACCESGSDEGKERLCLLIFIGYVAVCALLFVGKAL